MIGMICLLAVLFTSCVKDRNNYIDEQPVALLSVINASPDSKPLDFYLDQNKANSFPISYAHGLDYLRAYTGHRNATFYTAGTRDKVKTDTITLRANRNYSLFLSNSISNPDMMLLADTINRPASGMASIRFVDLSTDAPTVDLGVKGGAVLAASKTYKGYTSFMPIQGNSAYTLEIRQAGTTTVLVSLSNINLRSGSVYTVWLHGLAAATDQTKLAVDIQTNAAF